MTSKAVAKFWQIILSQSHSVERTGRSFHYKPLANFSVADENIKADCQVEKQIQA